MLNKLNKGKNLFNQKHIKKLFVVLVGIFAEIAPIWSLHALVSLQAIVAHFGLGFVLVLANFDNLVVPVQFLAVIAQIDGHAIPFAVDFVVIGFSTIAAGLSSFLGFLGALA